MPTSNGFTIPLNASPGWYEDFFQMMQRTYVAVSVGLLYDYFLTLDLEVEFVWKQPWKLGSILYLFVRYFGTLYNLASTILMLLPESALVSIYNSYLERWASFLIWWSVQGILQMRLYALYHCSKRLLGFMLVTFMTEVGVSLWILVSNSHAIDCTEGLMLFVLVWVTASQNGDTSGSQVSFLRPCYVYFPSVFQLMDVLVQGNVLYFLSPLIAFVAILISLIRWSFLETEAI
ncbi:hypothetical protein V8B97DRAFT_1470310 [Scleroderma yunnanense]